MSSSFRYTLTKLRSLPSSLKSCLRRSGNLLGQRRQHFADGRAGESTESCLSANWRKGRRDQDFGHIKSSFSAAVWSALGRKLVAWSNFPLFTESTTNEYQGQEFSRSVLEKYASQSGCEWKMPIRSRPAARALLVGGEQVFGTQFVAGCLLAFVGVFQRLGQGDVLYVAVDACRSWRRSIRWEIWLRRGRP